jgi:hypothetical protein
MVTRRLDSEERSMISPGCVYVWEERSPHADLTGVRQLPSMALLHHDNLGLGWY